uniref:Uncharacterized protein n=1 Tax=Anguilla anguilla TaxID=7936 RepID=A0A0E9Q878_ANGAN
MKNVLILDEADVYCTTSHYQLLWTPGRLAVF